MPALELVIIALLVVILLAILNIYQKMMAGHKQFAQDISEIKKVLINAHKKKKPAPPPKDEGGLENFDGAPDYSSLEGISNLERLGPHSLEDSYMSERFDEMDGEDSDPL